MREREGGGYTGIDVFRLVGAFLVAAIHVLPLSGVSENGDFLLTNVIARLAVPFFFMTSGFFTVTRYAKDGGRLRSFEKRTLWVYLAATALYLPVNVRNGYFLDGNWPAELVRDLVFDGTAYHLWYLPASMLGAGIAWWLVRRLDYPAALLISGGLYLLGLFGDSWAGAAAGMSGFYDAVFTLMDRTRSGVFFAPVFFVLGGLFADSRRESRWPGDVVGLGVSLAVMAGEAFSVRALGWARQYTMYLSLPVCEYFLFAALLRFRGGRRRGLRTAAMLVYIIHPMVIIAVRGAARALGLWGPLVENGLGHYLVVCALSAAVAGPLAWVIERRKAKSGGKNLGRAWREVDAGALEQNLREIEKILPPGCRVMAVVKANAYGHGEFEVARELERLGVRAWAVATVDEGIALRRYGIHGEVLILGWSDPARARELRRFRLTQTLISREYAERLDKMGVRVRAQVKIDTGMHRLGVDWDDMEGIREIFGMKNLRVTGMFTHFACSESRDGEAAAFTLEQMRRLAQVSRELEAAGVPVPDTHVQSTYGVLNYPELSRGCVRVGLGIYGVLSAGGESTAVKAELRPALALRARVALVRDVPEGEGVGYGGPFRDAGAGRVAILPIGYADGYPRALSGGVGYVLIRGKRAPVVGAVCMDQLAVDVTDIPDAVPGDVATVIGRDGEAEITATELAGLAGTITNEFLSRIGPRVETMVKNSK